MIAQERIQVDKAGDFGRVAVLLGGTSAEREISLMTGNAVLEALIRRGVDAHAVDTGNGAITQLVAGRFDRAWNALHGRGGEDGQIQGALESIGLPYTGTGVLGSALGMDKLRAKQLACAWGLETPRWVVMKDATDARRVVEALGLPLVVKPASEGSSVGVSKVTEESGVVAAWREAVRYDDCVLVEEWIEGSEYFVSVLQGEALPIVRIETPHEFYDYDAKYFSDETRYYCPCGLSEDRELACRRAALVAFDATAGHGWGRVDFLMREGGPPLFLEINSVPGMTSHSLVPMSAKEVGIDYDELVWRILETSFRQAEPEAQHGS
jgi:D-alanine-D-alanine ligase